MFLVKVTTSKISTILTYLDHNIKKVCMKIGYRTNWLIKLENLT